MSAETMRRRGIVVVGASAGGVQALTRFVGRLPHDFAGSTPPDRHMVLETDRVRVLQGPREHGNRPGIDALFRSAAEVYADRVVGVLLSGMLADGTHGLQEVKHAGGLALVQDPDDALYRSMPESAISNHAADYIASVEELADFVVELAAGKRPAAAGGA